MKSLICLFITVLTLSMFVPCSAQIKDVPSAITNVTRDQIEKMGQTNINAIIAAIPVGKGGENYSYGTGLNIQRNFGRSMIVIDGVKTGEGNSDANSTFNITKKEVEKFGDIGTAMDQISRIEIVRSNFSAEAGAIMLLGKTVKTGNYSYDYDNLTIVKAYAGYSYMVCDQGNVQLQAGPALGIYPDGSEFGFGASLNGYYNFTDPAKRVYNIITTGKKKPELSFGLGLDFYKVHGVDGIWNPNARLKLSF